MKYCEKCGHQDSDENSFCTQCGGFLIKRRHKKMLFILGIPSLIAVTLVIILIITSVLGVSETSSSRRRSSDDDDEKEVDAKIVESFDYELEDALVSGTKEVDLEPIAGVRLHADENALDKDREFKVEQLDDNEVIGLLNKMPTNDMYPLRGIEIDSSMMDNELFPGELEVSFDLVELGIPEELYNYLEVVRIHSDIEVTPMYAQLNGSQLNFTTDKNSIFVILCTLNALGVLKIYEDVEKYGSKELRYTKLYSGYYLFWPTSMPCGNLEEVEKQTKKITDLAKQYGFDKESLVTLYEKDGKESTNEALNKLIKMYTDQSVVDVLELVNSEQWQRENLWPSKVASTAENLEIAYNYLFSSKGTGRGFKKPSHIDIIIFDKWKGNSEQHAVTEAPFLGRAYMQINCENATIDNSDQIMTFAHELFHVSQLRYYFHKNAYFGGLSFGAEYEDLWFDEATAITLQFEAEKDLKLGVNEENTDRLVHIDLAEQLLADSKGDQFFLQNQGYFYSFLLEFLREKESDSNQYLHKLLERYNHDSVDTIFGKNNMTGLLNEFFVTYASKFHKVYLDDSKKADALLLDNEQATSIVNINPTGLSTTFKEIFYTSSKEGKLVFRFKDDLFNSKSLQSILMLDTNEKVVKVVNSDEFDIYDYEVPKECSRDSGNRMSCLIQEIQTDENNIDNKGFEVFVLFKPEAPKVTIRDEEVVVLDISLEESALVDNIIEEYQLNILCPSGSEYEIVTTNNELSLPINVSTGDLSEQISEMSGIISFKELNKSNYKKDKSATYEVAFLEITNGDNKVKGPVSEITSASMIATISIGAPRIVTYEMVEDAVVIHDFEAYSNYQKECTVEWDFDDGSDLVKTQGNHSEVSHEYSEIGEYRPKVFLYDSKGEKLAEDSISIDLVTFEEETENNEENVNGMTTYTVTIPFSDYDMDNVEDEYTHNILSSQMADQVVTLTVYKAENEEDDYTRIQFNESSVGYIYEYSEQYDNLGNYTGMELVGERAMTSSASVDGIKEGYNAIQDGFIYFAAYYTGESTNEGYLYDSVVDETYESESYVEAFIMLDTMTFEITFGPGSFVIPLE